jgi:hypothetical protein
MQVSAAEGGQDAAGRAAGGRQEEDRRQERTCLYALPAKGAAEEGHR